MRLTVCLLLCCFASFVNAEDPEYQPPIKGVTVNGEKVSADEIRKNYADLVTMYKAPGKPLTKPLLDKLAEKAREITVYHKAVGQYITANKLEVDAATVKSELADVKADLEAQGKNFEAQLKVIHKTEDEFIQSYMPRFKLLDATAKKLQTETELAELHKKFDEGRDKLPLRKVSHILISFEKCKFTTHPERPKDDATKLAQAAFIRVKAGEDFPALAKELSDDNRTKAKGGDLDWIKPVGDMPKTFSDAAYALKAVGDVSDVVESELGLHIIKLTDLRSDEDAFQKFFKLAVKSKTLEAENKIAKEAKVEDEK